MTPVVTEPREPWRPASALSAVRRRVGRRRGGRADAAFLDTSLDDQPPDLPAGVGALLPSLRQVGNRIPLHDAAARGDVHFKFLAGRGRCSIWLQRIFASSRLLEQPDAAIADDRKKGQITRAYPDP